VQASKNSHQILDLAFVPLPADLPEDEMRGIAADTLLQELADREAISRCLATYCRAVDRMDRDLLLSVYHPDAIDDHGLWVGSPEEFADKVFEFQSRHNTATQHYITNHLCELDGDVAHCETYYMLAATNREGEPLNISGGRYVDRFEKRDGRWAIAARLVLPEWRGQPGPSILKPEILAILNSGGTSSRDCADPSYMRPLRVRGQEQDES